MAPRLLPRDLFWRQQLKANHGGHQFEFQAVLENADDRLRVLFLTPYGTRALLLEQVGAEVQSEYFIPHELPFPPAHIMGDIHRVFFRGFAKTPTQDGTFRQRVDAEVFEDTWQHGRLVKRVCWAIRPADTTKKISIRYAPGYIPSTPPKTVWLTNGWHGYQIVIETKAAD